MRAPILHEEIYIGQHGAGNPKEFGLESDFDPPDGLCRINDAIRDGIGPGTDTGYYCDTTGGSSGSPVIARSTHRVIALHHWGTGGAACDADTMNGGVRIELIWPLVESILPPPTSFALEVEPDSLDICQPDDAFFDITIGESGSSAPVSFSVTGNPTGTTATFSNNPVIPPGTSVLSITNTAAATPGNYPLDVVGANMTDTLTSTIMLNLFDGMPSATTLTSPANGATNVSMTPTFEWTAVADASSYYLEVATDISFSNIVYTATTTMNNHTLTGADALESSTLH